jgi:hypothetical protein
VGLPLDSKGTPNQALQQTGAAIPVLRGMKV